MAEDLTQAQANEVIAALGAAGIPAEAARGRGARARYSVDVRRSLYIRAIQVLQQKGLPGEPRVTFNDLISQRGLMPNSREVEALRLDRALGAEIEEMLAQHPSLASVRVLVRLHQTSQSPAASVLAIVRPGRSMDQTELRDIVSRAVPALQPSQVFITLEQLQQASTGKREPPLTNFLWVWRVPESDYNTLAVAFTAGLIVVFVLGLLFGFVVSRYWPSSLGRGTVLRKTRESLPE